MRRPLLLVSCLTMLSGLTALAACGDDGESVRESSTSAGEASGSASSVSGCHGVDTVAGADAEIDVEMKEWTLTLSTNTVKAGEIAFVAKNSGTVDHEVVIVKGSDPAALPLTAEGKLDEDALPTGAFIGEIEGFAAGLTCASEFELAAGPYIVLCNIATGSDVHLQKGMVTVLTVTE